MYPCFRFPPSSSNDALRQTDHRFSTATFLSFINTAKAKASQQVPSVALDMVGMWPLHNHRCTLLLYTNRLAVPPVRGFRVLVTSFYRAMERGLNC